MTLTLLGVLVIVVGFAARLNPLLVVTAAAIVTGLSGFCGTLTTPMAANFNVVPVALLDLKDRYAVIKAQLPTALTLLIVNTVLMYVFVFP